MENFFHFLLDKAPLYCYDAAMMNTGTETANETTGAKTAPKGRAGADGCCPHCGAEMKIDRRLPGAVCSAGCGFEVVDSFD